MSRSRILLLAAAVWTVSGLLVLAGGFKRIGVLDGDGWALDTEQSPAAAWSTLLLLAAAAVAAGVAWRSRRVSVGGFAFLLLYMAVDEWFSVHETLERRTGVDWQVLFVPVGVAGAIAWLATVRLAGRGPAALLLCAGAAAWFVSQALEALQWDGDRQADAYGPLMVSEEGLELLGSSFFLLGLLALSEHLAAVRPEARLLVAVEDLGERVHRIERVEHVEDLRQE